MNELFEYFNYACIYFVIVLFLKVLWSARKVIRLTFANFGRDVELLNAMLGKAFPDWIWRSLTNKTTFKAFDEICKSSENRARTCFFYEDEKWTYAQVQSMSFQVANFFQKAGYRKGDVVALGMQNRPEVICIWLGLSRIGVITALVNYNLCGDSLDHCITISKCKSVIFGTEMREAFRNIWTSRQQKEMPQPDVTFYELDRYLDGLFPNTRRPSGSSDPTLNQARKHSSSTMEFKPIEFASCLRNTPSQPTNVGRDDKPHFHDTFLYIYTSGTTGKPKAARSTHSRLACIGIGSAIMLKLSGKKDISYCPLPLYHTFALSGAVWALARGVPLVIVPKFSASKFWLDMHYYKVTVCFYMGELCRFIVSQPPQPNLETNHSLSIMYGVGVKPEVWEIFAERFKIKRFVEAYGSTEGNCTMVNLEGTKIGAIGYVPAIMRPFYSIKNIRVDEITREIIRDKETGYGIACKAGEPGELVGKIMKIFPTLRYEGYTSREDNKKKIIRNLFTKRDAYFRSGDIVVRDEYGYYYFKDRMGDTFRWKGENVATAEIEGLILRLTDMKTNVVYGVKVPGTEGRAGMAAISDPDGTLDMKTFTEGLEKSLPSYARPVFIRVIRSENVLNMTGTFKLQKFNLQQEGFDIEKIADPIFVYSLAHHSYKQLDINTFKQIMQGNYRF